MVKLNLLKRIHVGFRLCLIERKLRRDGWEGKSLTSEDWSFLEKHSPRLFANLKSLGGDEGGCICG